MVDKMRDGVFPEDKAAKCFVQCVLENMQMVSRDLLWVLNEFSCFYAISHGMELIISAIFQIDEKE